MKWVLVCGIVAIAMSAAGGTAGAQGWRDSRGFGERDSRGSSGRDSRGSSSEYSVIWERNIFTRTRSQPTFERREGSYRPPSPQRPYLLTGVVREEDRPDGTASEYWAFVEDVRSRETKLLRAGDPLGPGRIKAMTLDSIEYEADGQTTQVELGSAFGPSPTVTAAATGGVQPTTMPAAGATDTTAPPTPDGTPPPGASIEEIMKARRQQMMNR